MKEDLLKIIENYGVLPQLKYFQSEVFELNEAIITRDLIWNYDTEAPDIKPYDNHIAEEISDVMVMLKQFQYHYGIDDEDIEVVMKQKIERQLKRIENDNE